jgi:hypothetical protein
VGLVPREGDDLAIPSKGVAPAHVQNQRQRSELRNDGTDTERVGRGVFGGDEKLTTALLDRLAHHATVIATKGKSYRMRKRGTAEERPAEEDGSALPKTAKKA